MSPLSYRYDPQKLEQLAKRRKDVGLSQSQAAKFFGLKHRDSVSAWELGESHPQFTRRSQFLVYLLDKLKLRSQPQALIQMWQDIMVGEWGWKPLSDEEVRQAFPGQIKEISRRPRNTIQSVLSGGERSAVPFLAPSRPVHPLVGRDTLLHSMKQRLFSNALLALTALEGLPGVGKTAVAVALAHDPEVLAHFSDGVLWAGVGRQGDILAHLGTWAAALNISALDIAKLASIEQRTRAIQIAIGTQRMLLVADDVWSVETALAFKLGGPNCAYLVTTRLPEVALRITPQPTPVTELDEKDALELLAQLAPDAVRAEPEEATILVRAVGGLPLAVVLMGNFLRVAAQSGMPRRLRQALDKLKSVQDRLALAEPQIPAERHPSLPPGAWISLNAVIGISDEALAEESRLTLRALSVFPAKPNTFSEEAAMTVSGQPVWTLDQLYDYGLLEMNQDGRYMLHQAIGDYARTKLTEAGSYARMVQFYALYAERHQKDYRALDLEINNMLFALQLARDQGMPQSLLQSANAFYRFLAARGLYRLAGIHLEQALQAVNNSGAESQSVVARLHLGQIAEKLGDYAQAQEYFRTSLALARDIDFGEGVIDSLIGLGWVAKNQGVYKQAQDYLEEGLALARLAGDQQRLSELLRYLGTVASNLGQPGEAEEYIQEGLRYAREIGDPEQVSALLLDLAWVVVNRGQLEQAEQYYQESLALAREIGYRDMISATLQSLGVIARKRGNFAQAEKYYQESLRVAREIGLASRVSLLLTNLGVLAQERGDYPQAQQSYREGLEIAEKIGSNDRACTLLTNLGDVLMKQGKYDEADSYLRKGLDLARRIDLKWVISGSLIIYGQLHLKQHQVDHAFEEFREGLGLAREMNLQESVADGLFGLAQVAFSRGQIAEARLLGEESLRIFKRMGLYKSAEASEWLAGLPQP